MKKISLYLTVLLIILVTNVFTPQEANADKNFASESIFQIATRTMSLITISFTVRT